MPNFFKQLTSYAVAQVKGNPVAVANIAGGLLNGAINRAPLPAQAKGLAKGFAAAVLTVATRALVQPIAPLKPAKGKAK